MLMIYNSISPLAPLQWMSSRNLSVAWNWVWEWSRATKSQMNLDKTGTLLLVISLNRLGRITSKLDSVLPFRDQVHNLGVLMDLSPSWGSQIAVMSRAAFNQMRCIAQFHPFLNKVSLRTLVHARVISHINYYKTLCGASLEIFPWRLRGVQNIVARLVAGGQV